MLLLAACRKEPTTAAHRAAGGHALLSATGVAEATVLGRVDRVAQIDRQGYKALLSVERSLAGPFTAGTQLDIAWEELSPERPSRFAAGDRVLAVVEPLPTGSMWNNRFPTPLRNDRVVVLAGNYDAFLLDPDTRSVDLLAAYLRLSSSERSGPAGIAALANVVADATESIAREALEILDRLEALPVAEGSATAAALKRALLLESRSEQLRRRLLALVARQRTAALRPVVAELAQPQSRFEAEALAALGSIDGSLPADQIATLLGRDQPAVRAVAVRFLKGPEAAERLAALSRQDPSPEVRTAAVERLVKTEGPEAVTSALPVLTDPDLTVRSAAAAGIGELGEIAVPALKTRAAAGNGDEAKAAILALHYAGPGGAAALREIAATHSDMQIRRLAELALGRASEHH
jgi:hypothetical protein